MQEKTIGSNIVTLLSLSILLLKKYESELSRLTQYNRDVASHFKENTMSAQNKLGTIKANTGQKDVDDLVKRINIEHAYNSRIYPDILNKSALLLCISMFEKQMCDYCDLLRFAVGTKFTFRDLAGHGIVKNENYLVKVLEIEFIPKSKNWQEILKYVKVRNIIAHNGGILKENERKPIKSLIDGNFILFDEKGNLILADDAIDKIYNSIIMFWKEMANDINEIINETQKIKKES